MSKPGFSRPQPSPPPFFRSFRIKFLQISLDVASPPFFFLFLPLSAVSALKEPAGVPFSFFTLFFSFCSWIDGPCSGARREGCLDPFYFFFLPLFSMTKMHGSFRERRTSFLSSFLFLFFLLYKRMNWLAAL